MREIKESKYRINYNPETATVMCEGSLLLNGAPAYDPILTLLKEAAEEQEPKNLTLDVRGLKFLNSSGINMLTKFVMYISDIKELQLTVTLMGLKRVAWQSRLVFNLQRLMPSLKVELL